MCYMRKHYLSTEQMNHLKNTYGLCCEDASAYIWESEGKIYEYFGKPSDPNGEPVYTIIDILNILPKFMKNTQLVITFIASENKWKVVYFTRSPEFMNSELIDALYDCLCWYLVNKNSL